VTGVVEPGLNFAQVRGFDHHRLRIAEDGIRQRARQVHFTVIRRIADGGPVRHGDPKLREKRLLGSQVREPLTLDGEIEGGVRPRSRCRWGLSGQGNGGTEQCEDETGPRRRRSQTSHRASFPKAPINCGDECRYCE
jgi:hypothetical protein